MTTTTSLITLIVVAVIVLAVTEPNRALPAVSAMILAFLAPMAAYAYGGVACVLTLAAVVALAWISIKIADDDENRQERIRDELRRMARGEVVR